MDLEATVDEVLLAAVDLIEITSYETELLAHLRPEELEPVMQQKQQVAHFYTNLMLKMERRKAAFDDLPEAKRREVIEVNDWLRLIVGENARMLRAGFEASERFLHAVKKAVQTVQGQEAGTYSRGGKVSGAPRTDGTVRTSLGYNEFS